MESPSSIRVEVAYASQHGQLVLPLAIASGATLEHAIRASGILDRFPEIDLLRNRVGVFGKLRELGAVLEHGDRIEIYHPLRIDPKTARRLKASKSFRTSD